MLSLGCNSTAHPGVLVTGYLPGKGKGQMGTVSYLPEQASSQLTFNVCGESQQPLGTHGYHCSGLRKMNVAAKGPLSQSDPLCAGPRSSSCPSSASKGPSPEKS